MIRTIYFQTKYPNMHKHAKLIIERAITAPSIAELFEEFDTFIVER